MAVTNTGIVLRTITGFNESTTFRQDTRTNIVAYSEDLSSASWSKTNATITQDSDISPTGELTADTINGLNAVNNKVQTITGINSANKTFTFSVWLSGVGTVNIGLSNNVDDAFNSQVELTNSLTRYYVTKTFNATSGNLIGRIISVSGDTATSCVVWGSTNRRIFYCH